MFFLLIYFIRIIPVKNIFRDFPGSPVVKNLPSNAWDTEVQCLVWGTKIPHVLGQQSPYAATSEPTSYN